MLTYIQNRDHYLHITTGIIPKAKSSLWIATADIKDLYIKRNNDFVPFLALLSELVEREIPIRLLFAKEPGVHFQNDFDKYPNLIEGVEQVQCPRVHLKMVIVDQEVLYMGSANLTGAGLGAKAETKRNFESGILTDEMGIVENAIEQFDSIWRGDYCRNCARKEFCTEYESLLQ